MAQPLTLEKITELAGPNIGVRTYSEAFGPDTDLRRELESFRDKALIFLWLKTETFGHWLSIWLVGNVLHFFDPYGSRGPELTLARTKSDMSLRSRLGEDHPYLLLAALRGGFTQIEWNGIHLQFPSPAVQTCGYWSLVRLDPDALRLSSEEFAESVLSAARALGLSTDELVTAAVLGKSP